MTFNADKMKKNIVCHLYICKSKMKIIADDTVYQRLIHYFIGVLEKRIIIKKKMKKPDCVKSELKRGMQDDVEEYKVFNRNPFN